MNKSTKYPGIWISLLGSYLASDGVNHDKDLRDKDVAEGRVDDDIVGQGTDGDGLQDEVVDGDKKEGVEDKCVRTEVLGSGMGKK